MSDPNFEMSLSEFLGQWGFTMDDARNVAERLGIFNLEELKNLGDDFFYHVNNYHEEQRSLKQEADDEFKWSEEDRIKRGISTDDYYKLNESKASEFTPLELYDTIEPLWNNLSENDRKKIIINTTYGFVGQDNNVKSNWNQIDHMTQQRIADNWDDAFNMIDEDKKTIYGLESKASELDLKNYTINPFDDVWVSECKKCGAEFTEYDYDNSENSVRNHLMSEHGIDDSHLGNTLYNQNESKASETQDDFDWLNEDDDRFTATMWEQSDGTWIVNSEGSQYDSSFTARFSDSVDAHKYMDKVNRGELTKDDLYNDEMSGYRILESKASEYSIKEEFDLQDQDGKYEMLSKADLSVADATNYSTYSHSELPEEVKDSLKGDEDSYGESWSRKSSIDKIEALERLGIKQGDAIKLSGVEFEDFGEDLQGALKGDVEDARNRMKAQKAFLNKTEDDQNPTGFNNQVGGEVDNPNSEFGQNYPDYNKIGESQTSMTKYECEHCNLGFKSNESLSRHHKSIHKIASEDIDGYSVDAGFTGQNSFTDMSSISKEDVTQEWWNNVATPSSKARILNSTGTPVENTFGLPSYYELTQETKAYLLGLDDFSFESKATEDTMPFDPYTNDYHKGWQSFNMDVGADGMIKHSHPSAASNINMAHRQFDANPTEWNDFHNQFEDVYEPSPVGVTKDDFWTNQEIENTKGLISGINPLNESKASEGQFDPNVADLWDESDMSERLKILSSLGITVDFDMAINGWSNLPLDVQITLEEINVAELRGESKANENKTYTCDKCGKVGDSFTDMAQEECPADVNANHQIPIFGDQVKPRGIGEEHYSMYFDQAYSDMNDENPITGLKQCEYCDAQFGEYDKQGMIDHANSHDADLDPVTGDSKESKASEGSEDVYNYEYVDDKVVCKNCGMKFDNAIDDARAMKDHSEIHESLYDKEAYAHEDDLDTLMWDNENPDDKGKQWKDKKGKKQESKASESILAGRSIEEYLQEYGMTREEGEQVAEYAGMDLKELIEIGNFDEARHHRVQDMDVSYMYEESKASEDITFADQHRGIQKDMIEFIRRKGGSASELDIDREFDLLNNFDNESRHLQALVNDGTLTSGGWQPDNSGNDGYTDGSYIYNLNESLANEDVTFGQDNVWSMMTTQQREDAFNRVGLSGIHFNEDDENNWAKYNYGDVEWYELTPKMQDQLNKWGIGESKASEDWDTDMAEKTNKNMKKQFGDFYDPNFNAMDVPPEPKQQSVKDILAGFAEDMEQFDESLASEAGLDDHSCPECGFITSDNSDYVDHLNAHED